MLSRSADRGQKSQIAPAFERRFADADRLGDLLGSEEGFQIGLDDRFERLYPSRDQLSTATVSCP